MRIDGRRVLVTGAGSGLGAALAHEALRRGATSIAALDRDADGLAALAHTAIDTHVVDLTDPVALDPVLDAVDRRGTPEVVIANAGVISPSTLGAGDDVWEAAWQVHVMSNVRLFRRFLPEMVRRGEGHLAATASTVAISPSPRSVVYSVTKHAQLALAEWLACSVRGAGVGVTCFCPGGMATPMLAAMQDGDTHSASAASEADTAESAAAVLLDAIEEGRFLVMTKERTRTALELRGRDYETWLRRTAAQFEANAQEAPGGRT